MNKVLNIFGMMLIAASAFAGKVNQIVAFGDSLSDTGNLYRYMNQQLPMSPPYYKGRFSSGPIWLEHVIRHYYPKNPLDHLVVYAFGGAGIEFDDSDDDDVNDGAMLTLNVQVDSYLLAHQGKAESDKLYSIWMGANNYLGLPDDLDTEINLVISGIQQSAERLVQNGGQHFLFVTLPNLGRTPMADEFEANEDLTYLTNHHNAKLAELVQQLQEKYPEQTWLFYDVNTLFMDAVLNPEHYNYKSVTKTCYDTLEYLPTQKQPILNMVSRIKPKLSSSFEHTDEDICNDFLFFDPVHPAGKAHQYISKEAIDVLDNSNVEFIE